MSPPERERRPAGNRAPSSSANTTPTGGFNRSLSPGQLRRAAAVRLQGGDPENPGSRYHRPSTGLRAAGYRQGYTACLHWVQQELWEHLNDTGRERLAAILARSEAA